MERLAQVVARYPERKVKIVNKENAGLPQARWSGLEVAEGEFIMHLDSDDWMEPDAVQRVAEEAIRTGADLVYYDFWKEYAHRSKLDQEKTYSVENKRKWMLRLYNYTAYGYIWTKMARKELYKDIFVPCFGMHEDIIFSTQLIWRAASIAQLSVPLIHYRRNNPTSVTREARPRRRLQSARNMLDLYVNGGPEVEVVKADIILRASWMAYRYDHNLFKEYPFLYEQARRLPWMPGRRVLLVQQLVLKCFLATHHF
jgi:glycosyltransferase involved in cell wall biosynthesis